MAQTVGTFINEDVTWNVNYLQLAAMKELQMLQFPDKGLELGGGGASLFEQHHRGPCCQQNTWGGDWLLPHDLNQDPQFLPVRGFPSGMDCPHSYPRFLVGWVGPVIEYSSPASPRPTDIRPYWMGFVQLFQPPV
jgi:hypothetical protein